MKKLLKRLGLSFSALVMMTMVGTTPVSALQKTVTMTKLNTEQQHIVWMAPKEGDLEHFYGAEDKLDGTFNYYIFDWNGTATPTSEVVQQPQKTRPVYPTEVDAANSQIIIKSVDGAYEIDQLPFDRLTELGFANPQTAVVAVMGVQDAVYVYAVKDVDANKIYLMNDSKELIVSQAIPGNMAVTGYDYANHGLIKVMSASEVKVYDFQGTEIIASGSYDKVEISPFGFITVETGSATATPKTKILDYEGNVLVAEMDGHIATYVTANVAASGDDTDYLKNGKYLFTVNDPVSDMICHYVLEVSGEKKPENPVIPPTDDEKVDNPKTSTGNVTWTIALAGCSIAMIYIATKKLKTSF